MRYTSKLDICKCFSCDIFDLVVHDYTKYFNWCRKNITKVRIKI